MNGKVPIHKEVINQVGYRELKELFRQQVDDDRDHSIEHVKEGWRVYLPV